MSIFKYVSVHDVVNMINPRIVEGQVLGCFAHGIGAALFEELSYDADGTFLSGTFAEYLCPTAPEVPPLEIGHVTTPSPANSLGSKGMGDGSSMTTPAALANAVADALDRQDIEVPLTLNRIWDYANGRVPEGPRKRTEAAQAAAGASAAPAGGLTGEGVVMLSVPRTAVWDAICDAALLQTVIRGCKRM